MSEYRLLTIQGHQPEALSDSLAPDFLGVKTAGLALHLGNDLFDKAGLTCTRSAGE
jgi:hypothetical protein